MAEKKNRIKEIEKLMQAPEFWKSRAEAEKFSQELAHLKEEIQKIESMETDIAEAEEFMPYAEDDEEIVKEVSLRLAKLHKDIGREETKIFFSGPYDARSALITIYAGAGGIDAQDWADMLLRMYERYGARKGYKTSLLTKYLGEEKGIKEATLEMDGKYAYGYLKYENGVHRLVRISPFSAQSLRHTSFALVEILPKIAKDSSEVGAIRPEEIEVQTFHSSGPGGQYVNKRDSAVRVKHLPTGIVVECQSERLQGENKAKAMELLAARIFARKMREEKKKIEELKGGFIPAEWGHQIRSYVIHPYKMVKDHRTNVETSDVDSVFDGDLDQFIEAEVRTVKL